MNLFYSYFAFDHPLKSDYQPEFDKCKFKITVANLQKLMFQTFALS